MKFILMKYVYFFVVNKHKPWIETSYHGVITENNDTVILDPPLVALDKDAPVPYAGKKTHTINNNVFAECFGTL